MLTNLLQTAPAQRAVAASVAWYLRFALRTTRWTIDGAANLAPCAAGGPVIAAFWHECLPLMPALWMEVRAANPSRRAKVLISRHRDGRFISDVLRRFAADTVHGSTARGSRSKGGVGAMRGLLSALQDGDIVVVTPDGPRGPPRVAEGGTAALAALSGAPVLPCAGRLRHQVRIGSWDRMILPLPFGRGVLVCLEPLTVARGAYEDATKVITAALTEAAMRAEALCR